MRTVQSSRLPSINWWLLKDFTTSTVLVAPSTPHSHDLPSLPPMGKLTDNFSNDNSKPHNVCACVIYLISFVVCLTFRFVASFIESCRQAISIISHRIRTSAEPLLVLRLTLQKVDSNRIKPHARIRITLPLATQQPASCCSATSVVPTTPNFSGGERGGGTNGGGSICSSWGNWGKEKTATHVNYINGNLMVCDCIDKNFNKTNY